MGRAPRGREPQARALPPSLDRAARRIDAAPPRAIVSDLDGVLRVFDPGLWDALDADLDLPAGSAYAAILGNPYLDGLVRGRGTHARWREAAVSSLVGAGADPDRSRRAVARWASTPAVVDETVREFLLAARDRGIAVFVFTNGTDRVRSEVEQLGLADVIGADARFLLNSHELGEAKPARGAFAAAHRRIEAELGSDVAPGEVLFLDDSARHVAGAAAFGWDAIEHPR